MDSRASLLVTEVEEGSEKSDFWGPLGGRPKDSYISLIKGRWCTQYVQIDIRRYYTISHAIKYTCIHNHTTPYSWKCHFGTLDYQVVLYMI